jgi:hypothetical protein
VSADGAAAGGKGCNSESPSTTRWQASSWFWARDARGGCGSGGDVLATTGPPAGAVDRQRPRRSLVLAVDVRTPLAGPQGPLQVNGHDMSLNLPVYGFRAKLTRDCGRRDIGGLG